MMACLLGAGTLSLASCGDVMDEITSLSFDRNLSPVGVEANKVTENSAVVNWTNMPGAANYEVEVFADDSLTYTGKAAQTLQMKGSEADLSGLVYDTKYSVRVRVLDANDTTRNSKWSGVYFRTAAQQILSAIGEANISDKTVTLHWPAGEALDQAVVYTNKECTQVYKTYVIPAGAVEAGGAKLDGLLPSTQYWVKVYNGGKERGSKSFKTIADLQGATVVEPGDDLATLIANATAGQVFALMPGTYTFTSDEDGKAGTAKVQQSITIKGIYPTSLPVIQGRFELYGGASLKMEDAVIDGTANATADQFFNFKEEASYHLLSLSGCEFKGAAGQKGFYYVNVAATIDSIAINNCLIHDIECNGGDLFDCRAGYIKNLLLQDNTIYNCAWARDFIRYDDKASNFGNPVPTIKVVSNTLYGNQNGTSGKRLVYVRFNGKKDGQHIIWQHNLVAKTQAVYTNQKTTSQPEFLGNVYFDCTNASLFASDNEIADPKQYWRGDTQGANGEDPQFKDAAKGDFTIGNEAVKKLRAGASRWLK